ncbi:transposase, partial [Solitalea sp. MAHUQ-68]
NLKYNKGFKRFLLRGKEKVSIEIGLLALAHNLSKLNRKEKERKKGKTAA